MKVARRAVVTAALLASACTRPRTELVVAVTTDFTWGPGSAMRAVRVVVRSDSPTGTVRDDHVYALGDAPRTPLPLSFGLVPAGSDAALEWIEASGCADTECASVLTRTRALVGFIPAQTVVLPMFLAQACASVRCDDPLTSCRPADGMCARALVDPATLPQFDPGAGFAFDAGAALDAVHVDVPAAGKDADASIDAGTAANVSDVVDAADAIDSAGAVDASVAPDAAGAEAAVDAGDAVATADAGDGGPLYQPSCAAPGTHGCGLVQVTGGSFTQGGGGCADGGYCVQNGTPAEPNVTVGNYAIDAYEVTVDRFRAFWNVRILDGGLSIRGRGPIRYPDGTMISWMSVGAPPVAMDANSNWTPAPGVRDAHPINSVDWWIAQEFCVWDGGRLPTDSEWEYAARGRTVGSLVAGRVYPWGNEEPAATCGRLQWHNCAGGDGGHTRPVGSFAPAGGVFDLAGNVAEWTADNFFGYSTGARGACANISGMTNQVCVRSVTGHMFRGGGFDETSPDLDVRSAARQRDITTHLGWNVGFRCARTLP